MVVIEGVIPGESEVMNVDSILFDPDMVYRLDGSILS